MSMGATVVDLAVPPDSLITKVSMFGIFSTSDRSRSSISQMVSFRSFLVFKVTEIKAWETPMAPVSPR